jgi:hypothetical protein
MPDMPGLFQQHPNSSEPAPVRNDAQSRAFTRITRETMSYETQYHRIKTAAKIVEASPDLIRSEISKGLLPASRMGRCILIADNDLRAYLDARRVKAVA